MSTGYASGMRKHRVEIFNREAAEAGKFGLDGAGIKWPTEGTTVWSAVDWAKGVRALNAGSVDAYAVKEFRMDYNNVVTMRSRVKYMNEMYQILPETFHVDKQANTIQFQAQVVVNE